MTNTNLHAHKESALLLRESDRLQKARPADACGHAVLVRVVVQVDGPELLLLRWRAKGGVWTHVQTEHGKAFYPIKTTAQKKIWTHFGNQQLHACTFPSRTYSREEMMHR